MLESFYCSKKRLIVFFFFCFSFLKPSEYSWREVWGFETFQLCEDVDSVHFQAAPEGLCGQKLAVRGK